MIVTPSLFVGEISVPNISSPEVTEELVLLINKYEPQCLENILGYELYRAYLANPTEQRIVDIIEGVEYIDSYNRTQKWKGLIYGVAPNRYSMIADYIYSFHQEMKAIWTSGIGTVVPKGSMVVAISPGYKITKAWNSFVRQNRDLYLFLNQNEDVYPEYDAYNSNFRTRNEFDI